MTFYACCAVVFVFYFARQVFALLFIAALGGACWRLLMSQLVV
jgi:hypothetical protein